MIKLFRRAICIAVLLLSGFVYLTLKDGGESFRRFGKMIYEKSEKVADKADSLKETADDAGVYVEKGVTGIKKAKEFIEGIDEIAGKPVDEKAAGRKSPDNSAEANSGNSAIENPAADR